METNSATRTTHMPVLTLLLAGLLQLPQKETECASTSQFAK